MAGKINTADLLVGHPFLGGAGHARMFNLAFAAPPNGVSPASITGAIVSVAGAPVSWTFMVYDPDDRTQKYWLSDAFENGVNFSVSPKFGGKMAGRSTSLTLTGIYSTKDGANLGELLLPPDLKTGDKKNSWHANAQVDHFVHENPTAPGTGWGVFAKLGASDGNPNPFQAFITGGIGGKGLFASRPQDAFGVGYFYYNLSDDLQSALDPLLEFDDETGIEAFYDFALAPGLRLAADVQYADPATGAAKEAFTGGLRLKVLF
jgi:porin